MARIIEAGDVVDVFWSDGQKLIKAHVLQTPRGPGDLWQFCDAHGVVHAVNGNGATFDTIIRRNDANKA